MIFGLYSPTAYMSDCLFPKTTHQREINDDNMNIEILPEAVPSCAYLELDIYLNTLKAEHYDTESQNNTMLAGERTHTCVERTICGIQLARLVKAFPIECASIDGREHRGTHVQHQLARQHNYLRTMDDDQIDDKANVARAIAALSMANLKVTPNLTSGIAGIAGTSSEMLVNLLAPSTSKASVTTTTTTSSIPSTFNITSGKRKLSPVRAPRATLTASDNPRPQVGIRAESPILLSVEALNESTFGDVRAGVLSGLSTSRQAGPASPVNMISYDHILEELNGMITELYREKDDSLRVLTEKVAKLTTEKEMARDILNDEELRRSGQFCRKCYKSTKFQTVHSITNCCGTVYYCSMVCQHSHWEIHSIVCRRVRPNTANENY